MMELLATLGVLLLVMLGLAAVLVAVVWTCHLVKGPGPDRAVNERRKPPRHVTSPLIRAGRAE